MSSAPAIGFEYRPSRSLPAATLVVAVLAMLAIALCALPLMAKLAAVAVVMAGTGMTLQRLSRHPVQAVGCGLGGAGDEGTSCDEAWNLRLRDVGSVPATLASWRVIGGFVLLRLRTPAHGMHTVLLGADNADADLRRRLRMRLAVQHGDEGARDS